MRLTVRGGHLSTCTMPRYWLMKSEPSEVSIDDLARRRQALPWTGVRNYQARNFMRDEMRSATACCSITRLRRAGVAGLAACRQPAPTTQFDPPAPTSTPSHADNHAGADRRGAERKTRLLPLREMRAARTGHDAVLPRQPPVDHPVTPEEWRAVSRLLAGCWSPSCWPLGARGGLSGRPAGHRRRHDAGAVPDLCCRSAASSPAMR